MFDTLVADFTDRLQGQASQSERQAAEGADRSRWATDPIGWITTHLRVPEKTIRWSLNDGYQQHAWDGTPDPFIVAGEALAASQNVGIEAGTGTNKTFMAACFALWFLDTFKDALVVTVAPKEDQLKLHLWKEIGKLWDKFQALRPAAERVELRIRVTPQRGDAWVMVGFPCGVGATEESATKAQGFHAEHMLFIIEETPGMPRPIMTALDNTCTAPHNLRLALGNPDNTMDSLHDFCTSPGTVHIRVSALDHPNVVCRDPGLIPGATSQNQIERRADKYGEDSPLYLSRVRGICPAEAAEALIKHSWCLEAAARATDLAWCEEQLINAEGAMGVDVANSKGGDKGAVAYGVGPVLRQITSLPCPDASLLGVDVALRITTLGLAHERVGVDAVGVGASTINKLRELNVDAIALFGSGKPVLVSGMEEKFLNLRAQMWYQLRMDLMHGRIALPKNHELFRDLTIPMWGTRGGKIWVEAKEDLKKRLGRSPDMGDAVAYWNWVRTDRGASVGGGMVDL